MTAVFVYSLFNFALPVTADIVWWFSLLGLAFALPSENNDWRGRGKTTGIAVSTVLVLAGSLTSVYAARIYSAQLMAQDAQRYLTDLEWSEAYKALSWAVKLEPDNESHRRARASLAQDLFVLTGEPKWLEQAENDLEKARGFSPRDLPTLSASYRFYLSNSEIAKAREMVVLARHAAPHDRRFVRNLAGLQALDRDLGLAVQTLLQNKETYRELPRLLYELYLEDPHEFYAALEGAAPDLAREACLDTAEHATSLGNAEAVSDLYGWLFERCEDPKTELLFAWASSMATLGEREQERRILEMGLASAPENHPLYVKLLVRSAVHNRAGTTARLADYLEKHPEKSAVRAVLAKKLPTEEAMALLSEGLEKWPGDPVLLQEMGETFSRSGMTQLADDYFRRALEHGGDKKLLEARLRE
jgi:tetratricopeptide (TPR) repeat protein